MKLFSLIAVCAVLVMVGSSAIAEEDTDTVRFNTKMTGFQETPSILTTGTGTFKSTLDSTGTSLSYTLTFTPLSSTATMSHIHFGEPGVAGAIFVFLCGGGGKPACPAGGGTVTGTITAADVLGVPAQGIDAGSFSELLTILRSGDAYVNVHSTNHPSGEIRGQIKPPSED
jgi:hypothetical protein